MRRFLKDHPWVWVVGLIVLVLGFEGIFFWIANSTLGQEFDPVDEPPAIEQGAAPAQAEAPAATERQHDPSPGT